MTEDQLRGWIKAADDEKAERAVDMPDDDSAMRAMHRAYQRLRDLGWAEAIYSPKDGTVFEALEAGCVVPRRCHYMGEWPKGGWWMHDGGDLWPSRPVLWRKLPDNDQRLSAVRQSRKKPRLPLSADKPRWTEPLELAVDYRGL